MLTHNYDYRRATAVMSLCMTQEVLRLEQACIICLFILQRCMLNKEPFQSFFFQLDCPRSLSQAFIAPTDPDLANWVPSLTAGGNFQTFSIFRALLSHKSLEKLANNPEDIYS